MNGVVHYLTIGEHICKNILLSDVSDDIMVKIGKDFCATYASDKDPLKVLKELRFGKTNLALVAFAIKNNVSSRKIMIQNDSARLSLQLFDSHKLPDSSYPYYISDMLKYCGQFIVIDDVESLSKGAGRRLLQTVIDCFGVMPLLLRAGYLYYGQYQYIDEDRDCARLLGKLVKYYEDIGFVNVNDYLGDYAGSTVMLHADEYKITLLKSGQHM